MIDKLKWLETAVNTLKNNSKDEWTYINVETELAKLELDSLDVVELQMMYEEDFECETLDPTEPIVTVKDLIKLMP